MHFEIIPNWHPVLVHYTIALLSISALFFLAARIFKKDSLYTVGKWNLWLGALITIVTVLVGLQASGNVAHDARSHAAMMNHRNWALGTASIFGFLAAWSFYKHRKSTPTVTFTLLLLLASSALAITGYKGGELVYRHGTGVMSLPHTSSHDHSAHEDQSESPHPDSSTSQDTETKNSTESHDHTGHEH
jgi:uncharacterized membrane protein